MENTFSPNKLTSLSIVLPAYNEATNISEAVKEAIRIAQKITSNYEVIVVNDGSTDKTALLVEKLRGRNRRIKLIQNSRNLGYGPTVRRGLAAASKDWIFFTDADRQFNLNEIFNLITFSDTYDFVIGKRVHRQDPFVRKLNAALFNAAVRLVFRLQVKDIDCAFKLMKGSSLRQLQLFSESAMISTEILYRAKAAGMSIKQIPVSHKPRKSGESSGGDPEVIKKAIKEFFRLRQSLLRSRNEF